MSEDNVSQSLTDLLSFMESLHDTLLFSTKAYETVPFIATWTNFFPGRPHPKLLSQLTVSLKYICEVASLVIAMYKEKRWLFKNLPVEYACPLMGPHLQALEDAIADVRSSP